MKHKNCNTEQACKHSVYLIDMCLYSVTFFPHISVIIFVEREREGFSKLRQHLGLVRRLS